MTIFFLWQNNLEKGKTCLLKTNVAFKLLVLEVGVRALPRLKEAEAMSRIVGFLRFAKALSIQSFFVIFFRKDRGRKQRLDLDKIEEAGKHSVSVSPAIQNRTRGLGLGDRSKSSAEMKVMSASYLDLMEKLQKLMADMDTYYNFEGNLKEVRTEHMVEGEYFAGRHSDSYWYRVRITKCIDAGSAAVRLVDYGDLSMLSLGDMQPLAKQFRELPLQAVNAKLANIKPVEVDWRPEDTVWFSNRVADQEFVSIIKKVSPSIGDDFECMIELLLIDTSHPLNDQYVDQELVDREPRIGTKHISGSRPSARLA